MKSQLVTVIAEKIDFFAKLSTLEAESDKRLEELFVTRDAHEGVQSLMRSVFGHSVEGLDAFINQGGTQLLDRF